MNQTAEWVASECCKLLQLMPRALIMKRKHSKGTPPRSVRASVSLSPTTYDILCLLADQRRVSTAWVIRDALEKYVADQWPLLERHDGAR
jgi:hypothetical protein